VQADRSLTAGPVPLSRAVARDLLTLFVFSAALALAVGLVKTRFLIPGHALIYRIPLLVLAGACGRPGMAAGSGLLGGLMARAWGGLGTIEFAGLLAAAAIVEAFGLGRAIANRGPLMALAGALAPLGKLGIKLVALLFAGIPLNQAGLPLLPTIASYLTFGLIGGGLAWGALRAWSTAEKSRQGTDPSKGR